MRNTLCPFYSACLDKAIEKNLAGWGCDRCIHRNKQVSVLNETDLIPETLMLWAIFKPKLYKLYRESEALKAMGEAMRKLLKIKEAMEKLGSSESTVRRLVNERKLEACKIRGSLRILASSLDSYIKAEILDFQIRNGAPEYPAD